MKGFWVLALMGLLALPVGDAKGLSYSLTDNDRLANESFTDRLFYGGSGGLSISRSTIVISLSPMIGYKLTEEVRPGVNLRFMYYNVRERDFQPEERYLVYGGGPFLRYQITSSIMAMTEYEILRYNELDRGESDLVQGLLVGGGYRTLVGDRSHLEIMVLYNLLEEQYENYPYDNPIIRVGMSF